LDLIGPTKVVPDTKHQSGDFQKAQALRHEGLKEMYFRAKEGV
jgi:hypothetical protein